jgi:hypothetical protein
VAVLGWGVPHFFDAATAAASGDDSRGGEKMLVQREGRMVMEDEA